MLVVPELQLSQMIAICQQRKIRGISASRRSACLHAAADGHYPHRRRLLHGAWLRLRGRRWSGQAQQGGCIICREGMTGLPVVLGHDRSRARDLYSSCRKRAARQGEPTSAKPRPKACACMGWCYATPTPSSLQTAQDGADQRPCRWHAWPGIVRRCKRHWDDRVLLGLCPSRDAATPTALGSAIQLPLCDPFRASVTAGADRDERISPARNDSIHCNILNPPLTCVAREGRNDVSITPKVDDLLAWWRKSSPSSADAHPERQGAAFRCYHVQVALTSVESGTLRSNHG
jgi:hypothetical protein